MFGWFCCAGRFFVVLNDWFLRSLKMLCFVVCCVGLCSIVLGCVKLVWIRFLLSMEFRKFRLFQFVSKLFSCLLFKLFKFVKLCYCVACFWLF